MPACAGKTPNTYIITNYKNITDDSIIIHDL